MGCLTPCRMDCKLKLQHRHLHSNSSPTVSYRDMLILSHEGVNLLPCQKKTTKKTCPIKDNIGIVPTWANILLPSLLWTCIHIHRPRQPGTASAQTICSGLTSGNLLLQVVSQGAQKSWVNYYELHPNLRKTCAAYACCWFSVKMW